MTNKEVCQMDIGYEPPLEPPEPKIKAQCCYCLGEIYEYEDCIAYSPDDSPMLPHHVDCFKSHYIEVETERINDMEIEEIMLLAEARRR
jgi:hypothetical protein